MGRVQGKQESSEASRVSNSRGPLVHVDLRADLRTQESSHRRWRLPLPPHPSPPHTHTHAPKITVVWGGGMQPIRCSSRERTPRPHYPSPPESLLMAEFPLVSVGRQKTSELTNTVQERHPPLGHRARHRRVENGSEADGECQPDSVPFNPMCSLSLVCPSYSPLATYPQRVLPFPSTKSVTGWTASFKIL